MRIFKNRHFHKWSKKQKIEDAILRTAVNELFEGLFDAKLGGLLYKKRIPVAGRGKRGGARTILAYQEEGRTFFLYGFLKNERDNISDKEQIALEELAKTYMGLTEKQLEKALMIEELMEIKDE